VTNLEFTPLVFGISVGVRHDDRLTRGQTWWSAGNAEVLGYTELVNDVRHDARRQLHLNVQRLGAEGVVIADMSITLPFTIWIVSNSIQDTPVELERASRVDGLSRIGSITRVAIPLARSGVRTGGLFAFLFSWNDLIYPLILIVSPGLIMIQPALAGMYNLIASNFSQMAAAAVIAMVPTMVIAVFAMRPLVRGFLSGAVKG